MRQAEPHLGATVKPYLRPGSDGKNSALRISGNMSNQSKKPKCRKLAHAASKMRFARLKRGQPRSASNGAFRQSNLNGQTRKGACSRGRTASASGRRSPPRPAILTQFHVAN